MPDIYLPCSACKQNYPMSNLKCSKGSDALTCFSCLEGKTKEVSTPSRSSLSAGVMRPSLSSPDWPVVGPSNLVREVSCSATPSSRSSQAQRPAGKLIHYRCANCSYSFSKHVQTRTTLRCPYCSKTSVRRVSYAVNEIDSLADY